MFHSKLTQGKRGNERTYPGQAEDATYRYATFLKINCLGNGTKHFFIWPQLSMFDSITLKKSLKHEKQESTIALEKCCS